jgi:long-subunit acyl-CoA synthetase (AMP-forming)
MLLPLAHKLFGKIRVKLGLDRARYCATGAAPIPLEVQVDTIERER